MKLYDCLVKSSILDKNPSKSIVSNAPQEVAMLQDKIFSGKPEKVADALTDWLNEEDRRVHIKIVSVTQSESQPNQFAIHVTLTILYTTE